MSRRPKTMDKAIVHGSIAFYLGKKADERRTHRWTVYVRGVRNEDLSPIIKQVVFQLHPSFENHVRVVDRPPYEVTELGWGEFQVAMRIHFHDVPEYVDIYHPLRLFPPGDTSGGSLKKPVVTEYYDEIVFNDPSDVLYRKLTQSDRQVHSALAEHFLTHSEQDVLKQLHEVHGRLKSEITQLQRTHEVIEASNVAAAVELNKLLTGAAVKTEAGATTEDSAAVPMTT